MSLLTVLLAVGATTRLTRLVTRDAIAAPLRAWSIKATRDPDHPLAVLLRCPWCLGVWTGAAVAVWAWCAHGRWYYTVPALALTAAQVAGLAAGKE